MEGVDYSWGRPDLDALWAAGKRFVSRYLAYLPNGKVLDRAELRALHAKGFGVVLNWEQAAGDMLRGRVTGTQHAHEAARQAGLLGAPPSIPIYFSCDTDITSNAQLDAVAAYLDGCAGVLGRDRVGVYGEYAVIERMLSTGKAKYGWQTYAWSGGRVNARAHVLQYRNGVVIGGADVDLNRTLQDSFGAWWPAVEKPTEGKEMLLLAQHLKSPNTLDPTVYAGDGVRCREVNDPTSVRDLMDVGAVSKWLSDHYVGPGKGDPFDSKEAMLDRLGKLEV